ncbi:MAG TPA: NAD(P)/FAD-dependent oxidoreductase [Streptosporangiaceae bacterium]|jgi:pyruvate/2-oxoglutarate dehydrogenase complex dihydrolipoamide dehydrogenase (E3) component
MTVHETDIVVIGMGPGGEDAAGRLAQAGLHVTGIESKLLGGECPYWGCVPSKMMIRAANLIAETRRVPGMAGSSTVNPDWSPVAHRIREEATDSWDDKVAVDRFTGKGGHFVRGFGRITAPGEVAVGADVYRARRGIIVASGTEPAVPPIDGLAGTPYWTNREAIETESVPSSLVVLGGGSIGAELAQVFARFGAQVTVVEAMDRLVPPEEPEASRLLAEIFTREGVAVRTGAKVTRVEHSGATFTVTLQGADSLVAERLLVTTGRRADLGALGMGAVGVDEDAKAIPVDDRMRVADGVWALGDITGKGAYTHVSMYQAAIVARDILGEDGPPAEYQAVPRVTFTDPEIGAVGLTEAQAREQGLPVRTGTAQVPSSARGWIHKAGNDGFIKLVADTDRGVLVGATSAGPCGGEVLSALSVAVHGAVPIERLRNMIYAYPTFHRGIEDALRELADQ